MQVMTTPNPFFSSANPPVCGKGNYPLEMRKNRKIKEDKIKAEIGEFEP